MLSYKEKKRAYLELKNNKCIMADCELLRKKWAVCPSSYLKNPLRHADSILFALLDLVTKEEILQNREVFYAEQNSDDSKKDSADDEPKNELNNEPKTEAKSAVDAEKVEVVETPKKRSKSERKRVRRAEKRADEAENRAEEAENRADEAENRAEEAENRAAIAGEELEQEKKKD